MKTIAFSNIKGGVGKTTSAVNVAYDLSAKGKRVLLVDLDPQSNSSDFYGRCGNTKHTVADLLTNGNLPLDEVAVPTDYDRLDIISAYLTLGRAEKLLISDTATPQQFRLKRYLTALAPRYDYCILDCSPAAESIVNINGLAAADVVYVPMRCDKWAIAGLESSLQVINTVSSYNDRLTFGGAFFTCWERCKVGSEVHAELEKQLGNKLLNVKIRKTVAVTHSSYTKPLSCISPRCTAAVDYEELTDMIERSNA